MILIAAPLAALLALFLLGNFEEIVLDFYRRRSEAEPARASNPG